MNSNKKTGRIVGILFLLIFISGIVAYQVLQGPILTPDEFLTLTFANSGKIILSTLLGFFSGILSISIAVILFPIFKKKSVTLAFLYLAFSILNFVVISIDNVSVISMLELSKEHATNNSESLKELGNIFYKRHWWTHYFILLISCFPVFILYYTLYVSKLVPKIISSIGIIAVILMFIEVLLSILGRSISMNMLLPIGLIQLFLPIWLLFKGLNSPSEKSS